MFHMQNEYSEMFGWNILKLSVQSIRYMWLNSGFLLLFFHLIYLFMIVGYGSQSFIIVLNYTYAILSSLFIFIKLFLCLIQEKLEWEYFHEWFT